jgi:hypothetical protein
MQAQPLRERIRWPLLSQSFATALHGDSHLSLMLEPDT